jgi:integrase
MSSSENPAKFLNVLDRWNAKFPDGKIVSDIITELLKLHPELLSTWENQLRKEARIAEIEDSGKQFSDMALNCRPEITDELYSLFIPYQREQDSSEHLKQVCNMLRCAALVDFLGPSKSHTLTELAIKNIKRRLNSNPNIFADMEEKVAIAIQAKKWNEISSLLQNADLVGITPSHIEELSKAASVLQQRHVNVYSQSKRNHVHTPSKPHLVEVNSDHTSQNKKVQTENQGKRTSYHYGAPDNWFGNWQNLALISPIARSFLKFLHAECNDFTDASLSACCCEIALISGRNPVFILHTLTGLLAEKNGSLTQYENGTWKLIFLVLNREHFAKDVPLEGNIFQENICLNLPIQTSHRLNRSLKFIKLPQNQSERSGFIKRQTKELDTLLQRARTKVHPSITKGRISMTFAKTHFHRFHDIPLLQLICSYDFEASLFSLSYLWFDPTDLQKTVQIAINDLFPDEYSFPTRTIDDRLIGAPLAYYCNQHLNDALTRIDSLQKGYRPRKKATPAAWCDYHQNRTAYTALLLAAQIGHRITSALDTLTLAQIDPAAKLVVFRDKATTVAERRRAAALGQCALNAINDYLEHLQTLRKKAKTSFPQGMQKKLIQTIDGALSGHGPLFFFWPKPRTLSKFSLVKTWNETFPEELPQNLFRHILANELRKRHVAGVFAEAHLGHFHGIDLFGKTSSISPSDFSREVSPALDNIFSPCSQSTPPKFFRADWNIQCTVDQIAKNYRNEQENDQTFYISRYREEYSISEPARPNESVEIALKNNIDGYDTFSPPRGISLTKEQIDRIKTEAISSSSSKKLDPIFHRLRRRLRELKESAGWVLPQGYGKTLHVIQPFPLYQSDLLASHWRRQVLEKLKNNKTNPLAHSLALMILAGSIESEAEFEQLVLALKEKEFTLIDMQTISLDIGNLDQAFCAVGHVAICLIAAKRAIQTLTSTGNLKKQIWQILPGEFVSSWSDQSFKRLIEVSLMANRLDIPPILHAARNQSFNNRALSSMRLLSFLHSGRSQSIPQYLETELSETRIPSPRKTYSAHAPLKRELTALIENPDSVVSLKIEVDPDQLHPGHKKAHLKLLSWRATKQLPPIMELLADWAEILLSPSANRRTGGKLATSTISNYINIVYEPLKQLMDIPAVSEAAPGDIEAFLDQYLESHRAKENKDDDKRIIARCINEAGNERFPRISANYSSTPNDRTKSIHADVYSSSEKALMLSIVDHWAKDPRLGTSQVRALDSLRCLINLLADYGMRISEATGIDIKDIQNVDNVQVIYLRNNSQRNLKTKSSTRILTCPENTIPNPERFVSDLQGPHKTWLTELITDLVKLSSVSPKARLHLFRHSKGSDIFLKNFTSDTPPLNRAHALEAGRNDLGHASLTTTAEFYSHVNQYLHARELSGFHPSFNLEMVAKLMGTKRPARDFHLNNHPMETDLTPLLPKPFLKRALPSHEKDEPTLELPPITRIPKIEDDSVLLVRKLYVALCRGEFAKFISKGNISGEISQKFLFEVQKLSQLTGFNPVPSEQIATLMNSEKLFETNDTPIKFWRSKSIDIESLEEWGNPSIDLNTPENLDALKSLYEMRDCYGRHWNARTPKMIFLYTGIRKDKLAELLSNTGCPLLAETDMGDMSQLIVRAHPHVPMTKTKTLPRLIMFGILLDYRLRVHSEIHKSIK